MSAGSVWKGREEGRKVSCVSDWCKGGSLVGEQLWLLACLLAWLTHLPTFGEKIEWDVYTPRTIMLEHSLMPLSIL